MQYTSGMGLESVVARAPPTVEEQHASVVVNEVLGTVSRNGTTFSWDTTYDGLGNKARWWIEAYPKWEPHTFTVFDSFLDKGSTLIDIGGWIGPTTLYAAPRCARVYVLDPDPVVKAEFCANIAANDFRNITFVPEALCDTDGPVLFGGNGPMGNSESTILVRDPAYVETGGHLGDIANRGREFRATQAIQVQGTTIESLERRLGGFGAVGLVKMDIEGGEKFVVPAIAPFLERTRCTLYLSLHWVFLQEPEIAEIARVIFDTYPHVYARDNHSHSFTRVNSYAPIRDAVMHDLICTFCPIPDHHRLLSA